MKYIFSIVEPHTRFVSIEMQVSGPLPGEEIELQLPSWRPGRYELGNFAKNIKGFSVADQHGNAIPFKKSGKDCWKIKSTVDNLIVKYQYYAAQPDAGACYLDAELLYINPVHCCFFIKGREQEKCEVILQVPAQWKVATGMQKISEHNLSAENFDQLVDCPFMASPYLMHSNYTIEGITFNIWIHGNAQPDWFRIIKDFEAFTEVQLKMMKEFPSKEYHFLVLLLPFPFYHGVEHLNSTVLALGPGYKLMQTHMYKELLGVASHELFHVWNVKSIRPVEMLPYDFSRENYAETGYVYEGVTTYYGDLFLCRSTFFSLKELLTEYSARLQKHMDNPGRFNYSVAQSSFDTWLDGYTPGVPGRKTSIYDEGSLLALALDFMIRSATQSQRSLDDVMRTLYFEFAKNNKGYSGNDFIKIAETVAGRSFTDFFENYVYKANSYDSLLGEVVSLAGIMLKETSSSFYHERAAGMKTELRNGLTYVTAVHPGSPAAIAGISKDDEIVFVNDMRVENNLSDLMEMNSGNAIEVIVSSGRKLRKLVFKITDKQYYSKYSFEAEESCTHSQLQFRQYWISK